ncbi:hypothetical protein NP493_233g04013 [Ridgeia piscesae]|uniref:Sodium/hydrogen exchanger n=1 Tax=Ridgeia piscesae TaxID=27915 RepID=A0AAD9UDN1_RIDPI|nr:hypothetical protein NP493_233g04013 [Ridgeia piscesae]
MTGIKMNCDISVKMTAFLLIMLWFGPSCAQQDAQLQNTDEKQESKLNKNHRIDSENMLMFISLLVLNVLTIWLFKHRRFRFIHETGLAIIYGLIMGAIIRYSSTPSPVSQDECVTLPSFNTSNPPNKLKLAASCSPNDSTPVYHQYIYSTQVENADEQPQLNQKATFDPEVFFNVLLPPIIFNAGYSMRRKSFFKNFGAIMTYAFLGTLTSTFVIGLILFAVAQFLPHLGMGFNNCLLFGAIISATDPVTVLAIFTDLKVDVDLNALVFGESVLNDAVAIVLSDTVEQYKSDSHGFDGMAVLNSLGHFLVVFFGAGTLGSVMACLNALLTKYTHIHEFPLLETSLFFLMSYGTFLAAEALGMTGIVAVLFCGICQAHYTFNNLSTEAKVWTKQLFEVLNFLMENFVFIYIGVSTFTFTKHEWNPWFIIASFIAVLLGRMLNVYPLSFLLNLGRSNKIHYNIQHMMMFSGLRGAMAFALAIRNTGTPQRRVMFTTTLLIVETTVILCGGFTTPMLQWLRISVGIEDEPNVHDFEMVRSVGSSREHYLRMDGDSTASPSEPQSPPMEPTPGRLAGKAKLVKIWYNIDSRYVKPLLTNAWPPLTQTLPSCCLPLATMLTTQEQLQQCMTGRHRDAEESDTDLILESHDQSYGANQQGAAERIQSISCSTDSQVSLETSRDRLTHIRSS